MGRLLFPSGGERDHVRKEPRLERVYSAGEHGCLGHALKLFEVISFVTEFPICVTETAIQLMLADARVFLKWHQAACTIPSSSAFLVGLRLSIHGSILPKFF